MSDFFIEREAGGERTLLVQMRVYQADHHDHFDEALAEFKSLAESAAGKILSVIERKLNWKLMLKGS